MSFSQLLRQLAGGVPWADEGQEMRRQLDEARKELSQVRTDLQRKIQTLESERNRLSEQRAEEREEAELRVHWVQASLDVERAAREEREAQVARLAAQVGDCHAKSAQEKEEATRHEQVCAKLLWIVANLGDQRDRLAKELGEERGKPERRVRKIREDRSAQRAGREEKEREIARLAAQMEDLRVRTAQEKEEALARKDEETRKKIEQVRGELMQNVKNITSNCDRLSKQYVKEKAIADKLVHKIQEDLDTERAVRGQKERDLARLTSEMESGRALSAQEKEEALALKDEEMKKLDQLRGELLMKVTNLEGDRNRLVKEHAEEKNTVEQRLRSIQEDLDLEKAAREERDSQAARLAGEMGDLLVRGAQEREQALALKDEETRKLEQVRAQLVQEIEDIESDRDSLSKEYAGEKEKAEQRIRTIQDELDVAKEAHEKEAATLKAQMEDLRVRSNQEVEAALALKDEETKKLEQVRAQLVQEIEDIESDRDSLSKEYAEEKEKAEQRIQTMQGELDVAREAHEKEAATLKAQIEDLRVRSSQEVEAVLALKDEEAKKLEQVRAQLLLKIQILEHDHDRFFKERAEETASADALLRTTRQDLDTEKAARAAKEGDVARLTREVERSRAQSAQEREESLALTEKARRELEQVREQLGESLGDRARLSREHAEEKAKAEERAREIQDARTNLLNRMQTIESDRERLSKELAEERARADERVRKIQEDLDAERAAHAERQQEIVRLTTAMENNRALNVNAGEREQMDRQLKHLKSQMNRGGGGLFGRIGRAIDSFS